jgi:hypothetical protein
MRRIGLGLRNRKEVPYQKVATGDELPEEEEEDDEMEKPPSAKKKAPAKKLSSLLHLAS